MKRALKRLGIFLAIGGVLGDIVMMLLAPSVLTWFQTPAAGGALCNCQAVAKQTAGSVVRSQLIGTLVGAVVVAVIGELIHRARKKKAQAAAQAAAPPPAAPAAPPPAA